MASHEQPIIVVKKRKREHAHHGGSWKVAYADFVTAMMAFFLVMWIIGLDASTKKSVEAYFKDPTGFNGARKGAALTSSVAGDGILPGEGAKPLPTPDASTLAAALKKAAEELKKDLAGSPEFKEIRNNVDIQLTDEGLRIEMMEASKPVFFSEASSAINQRTERLLQFLGRHLAKIQAPLVIEGHTDARPMSSAYGLYTNWELSADRANAARRVLEQTLRPGQITGVKGFAAMRLRNLKDPAAPENRRVSILVPLNTGSDKLGQPPPKETEKSQTP